MRERAQSATRETVSLRQARARTSRCSRKRNTVNEGSDGNCWLRDTCSVHSNQNDIANRRTNTAAHAQNGNEHIHREYANSCNTGAHPMCRDGSGAEILLARTRACQRRLRSRSPSTTCRRPRGAASSPVSTVSIAPANHTSTQNIDEGRMISDSCTHAHARRTSSAAVVAGRDLVTPSLSTKGTRRITSNSSRLVEQSSQQTNRHPLAGARCLQFRTRRRSTNNDAPANCAPTSLHHQPSTRFNDIAQPKHHRRSPNLPLRSLCWSKHLICVRAVIEREKTFVRGESGERGRGVGRTKQSLFTLQNDFQQHNNFILFLIET